MRIDIGGGGKVAVTEPFLNLLHGDAVGQQQTGTAMTKIVIANADAPFFHRLVVVLNLRKIQHTLSRLFGRILHFLLPQQKLVFVQ